MTGRFEHLKSKYQSLEAGLAAGAITDLSLTPIVLFKVSVPGNGTPIGALKLSKHETSRYVEVQKEEKRNSTYMCDVYHAMVAFIPAQFNDEAYKDHKAENYTRQFLMSIYGTPQGEESVKIWRPYDSFVDNLLEVTQEFVYREKIVRRVRMPERKKLLAAMNRGR
jgi:hypothetical protein